MQRGLMPPSSDGTLPALGLPLGPCWITIACDDLELDPAPKPTPLPRRHPEHRPVHNPGRGQRGTLVVAAELPEPLVGPAAAAAAAHVKPDRRRYDPDHRLLRGSEGR